MNNTTKASYLLSERNRYLLEVLAMFKKEHRYPGRGMLILENWPRRRPNSKPNTVKKLARS